VIHPGDGAYMRVRPAVSIGNTHSHLVQQVFAVGKPPDDKVCFFRGLKNVAVLPAIGAQNQVVFLTHLIVPDVLGVRSLASCLAGGDLDGYAGHSK